MTDNTEATLTTNTATTRHPRSTPTRVFQVEVTNY